MRFRHHKYDIFFFDPQNAAGDIDAKVEEIQKQITIGEKTYQLKAIVDFVNSNHYTAILLRPNGCWENYDDCMRFKQPVPELIKPVMWFTARFK